GVAPAVVDDVPERLLLRRRVDTVLAAPVQELGVRHDGDGELLAVRVGAPPADLTRAIRACGQIGEGRRLPHGAPDRPQRRGARSGQRGVAQKGAPVLTRRRLRRYLTAAVVDTHDYPSGAARFSGSDAIQDLPMGDRRQVSANVRLAYQRRRSTVDLLRCGPA